MGNYVSLHVGPYLECHNKIVHINNSSNLQLISSNPKVNTSDYISTKHNRLFHILTDESYSRNIDIYISNTLGDFNRGEPIKDNCPSFESISQNRIESELAEFSKFHEKDIDNAKKMYGEDQVFVRWGYITYWN